MITTSTYKLMESIRYNLKKDKNRFEELSNLKDFQFEMGFISNRTIKPIVTVFPIAKRFGDRWSGGKQNVTYDFTIDIYSDEHFKIEESKEFCLNIIDSCKTIIKENIRLTGEDNRENVLSTDIGNDVIFETPDAERRGFISTASLEISCKAHHQINPNRIHNETIQYGNDDLFIEKLAYDIEQYLDVESFKQVRDWIVKINRPEKAWPAIKILPGNTATDDVFSNTEDLFLRNINFNIILKSQPNMKTIKNILDLSDAVVEAIEKSYKVQGFAQNYMIDSIIYDYVNDRDRGFEFNSTISVRYWSRKKYNVVY